jgi:hypothetical protein
MRYLIPLLALSSLSACNAATGDTSTGTRTFPVPGAFDQVTLGGPDNVRVVTGGTPSIVATGRNADLDKIEVELKGSELVVSRDSQGSFKLFNWNNGSHDVTVTVTVAKPISGANLKGSGDLNVDQGGGDNFAAELKGSGDLTVAKIMAQAAHLTLAGSGDLKAGGQAKSVAIDLAGSGGIDADKLIAETAQIELRGSGDIQAHASQSAKVMLKGSGDVTIKGTGNCQSDKRGSGDVHCAP